MKMIFNVVSSLATLVIAIYAVIQANAAKASTDIAKNSIVLTHRPKIIIRSVVIPWLEILNRHTPMTTIANPNLNAERLDGFFYAINIGNQPATIIGLDEYMAFTDKLPMERPYESGKDRKILNINLQPGEACKIPFSPKETTSMELAVVSVKESPFCVAGRIIYSDQLRNCRETAFCRQVDHKIGRLVVVSDSDYEYAD